MRRARTALFLLPATAVLAAPAGQLTSQQQQQQMKQAADGAVAAAKRKGLSLVRALPPEDVDGDGKLDVVAVVKDERDELVVAKFRGTGPGQVAHQWTGSGTGAQELKAFELKQLVGDAKPEAVLELLEKSPDDTRRQLRVYKMDESTPREILSLSFVEDAGDKSDEEHVQRVSYGDDEPGYRVKDTDGDGSVEVVMRREPKVVKTHGKLGAVHLVIGIKEVVYSWDRGTPGKYALKGEKAVNFLPSLRLKKVMGSSQKLPEDMRKAQQDKALEASFNEAFEDDPKNADKTEQTEEPKAVEYDPAPLAFWATDNKFDTSWVESARGDGTGEWLELHLREESEIRMVRLVPVCAFDEKDMETHNEIIAFSLLTTGMGKTSVDRREKVPNDNGVLAVLEVPSPERKFAPQVLVFLQKGTKSPWVRLVIDKVKRHGKANEACISELSIH